MNMYFKLCHLRDVRLHWILNIIEDSFVLFFFPTTVDTLLWGHYQARFQMYWDSKILLNYPLKRDHPAYQATFSLQIGCPYQKGYFVIDKWTLTIDYRNRQPSNRSTLDYNRSSAQHYLDTTSHAIVSFVYKNSTPNLDFDSLWYNWFIFQDVLTDLKADAETLPLDPIKEDWVGHKVIYCVADGFILVSICIHSF